VDLIQSELFDGGECGEEVILYAPSYDAYSLGFLFRFTNLYVLLSTTPLVSLPQLGKSDFLEKVASDLTLVFSGGGADGYVE